LIVANFKVTSYTVQGYSPGHFPRTTVAELPLMFSDAQLGTRVLWNLYKEGLLEKDYEGLKVLSLYAGVPSASSAPPSRLATSKTFAASGFAWRPRHLALPWLAWARFRSGCRST
jgi:hypothetical protein